MPGTPSVMSLHLRYRLWIAELNFDINVLRIFGDYLNELRAKRKEAEVKSMSDYFEKEFTALRAEIDEMRHEMHIAKMNMGEYSRDGKPFDFRKYNKENHIPIKKRLAAYKVNFKKINTEFGEFEGKWLS
jgi:hypothetical protein